MSCALYLLCFNGLLKFLQHGAAREENNGVDERIIFLAFADDLRILTKCKTSVNRLSRDFNLRTEKKWSFLDLSKCRTFLLLKGFAVDVTYKIKAEKLQNIFTYPIKFFGTQIFAKKNRKIREPRHR